MIETIVEANEKFVKAASLICRGMISKRNKLTITQIRIQYTKCTLSTFFFIRIIIYVFNFRNRAVSGLNPENVAKRRGPGARLRMVCFSSLRMGVSRRDSGCLLSCLPLGGGVASACPCHSWYRPAEWRQGISLRGCFLSADKQAVTSRQGDLLYTKAGVKVETTTTDRKQIQTDSVPLHTRTRIHYMWECLRTVGVILIFCVTA